MVPDLFKLVPMVPKWLKMTGGTRTITKHFGLCHFSNFSIGLPKVFANHIHHILEQWDNSSNCRKNGPRPLKIGPNGPKMAQNVGTDRTNSKHFGLCHFSNFLIGLCEVFANHIYHIFEQRDNSTNYRKIGHRHLKIGPNGPKMAQNVGTDRTNSKHFGLCHFSNFSIGLPKVFANHNPHISHLRAKG